MNFNWPIDPPMNGNGKWKRTTGKITLGIVHPSVSVSSLRRDQCLATPGYLRSDSVFGYCSSTTIVTIWRFSTRKRIQFPHLKIENSLIEYNLYSDISLFTNSISFCCQDMIPYYKKWVLVFFFCMLYSHTDRFKMNF